MADRKDRKEELREERSKREQARREALAKMGRFASYTAPSKRHVAMTWGAEDLSAALGALTNKEPDGSWTFPYQVARAQCLFAAGAAGAVATTSGAMDGASATAGAGVRQPAASARSEMTAT